METRTIATDWKTWALGVFFVIAMATSGATYTNLGNRVATLEIAQRSDDDLRVAAIQATAIQVAVLQDQMKNIQSGLDDMKDNQALLLKKIDLLLGGVHRDSTRWNQEMNQYIESTAPKQAGKR